MNTHFTRRGFVRTAATAVAAATAFAPRSARTAGARGVDKPARLGGEPAHSGAWPKWPQWNRTWEPKVLRVLRSGRWYRGSSGGLVPEFETAYAKLIGSRRCLATASGTTALTTALHVAGVDAGDEVIVSPYTFIATYNAVLMLKALPVFADTDPATLTMDPTTIESRIAGRTRAILPVHIFGMPCEMDAINAIAARHDLMVVEDACQAWLAEYHGRMCGSLGDLGCFSFQNSKHITSGEGGAITGDDDGLLDRCYAFHNCGHGHGSYQGKGFFTRGNNYRMQHFQAAMLLQQFDKLIEDTELRRNNAERLGKALEDVPGVTPARLPANSRAIWHLFPLRYDAEQFHGLSRRGFIKALDAEGVPCSAVYKEQYFDGLLDEAIDSRGFQRLFGAMRLRDYRESLHGLSGNRQVVSTTVGLPQNLLLATEPEIDQIATAIHKIQAHSEELAEAS